MVNLDSTLEQLVLGSSALSPALIPSAVRKKVTVRLDGGVRDRLVANAAAAVAVVARNNAYGRTTGVGANRNVPADDSDGHHGLRLLRSHACGAGERLSDEVGRATMIIRLNQLAGARSGIATEVVDALLEATNAGLVPIVRSYGGLGTGDITVLAELALSLMGELPWADGSRRSFLHDISAASALPLMSSSAPTLAVASLALGDIEMLTHSLSAVGAISAVGVRANSEAWSEVGAGSHPHQGTIEAGQRMRAYLLGTDYDPQRLQDPFGWRCLPQVNGTLIDAVAQVERVLTIDCAASTENPLYVDGKAWHQGGFHHGALALALDQLRLAIVQAAGLSLSRLTKLNDQAITGLRPFLADGPAGSSGTMVLEYTAASAMAALRRLGQPATLGQVSISLGLEDHGSFAWESAMATTASIAAFRTIIACELLAADRAIALRDQSSFGARVVIGTPLQTLLDVCSSVGPGAGGRAVFADRIFIDDIEAYGRLLSAEPFTSSTPAEGVRHGG